MTSPRCPRCGNPLYVTLKADYGHCIYHGDVFLGMPLEETKQQRVNNQPPTGYLYKRSVRRPRP